MKEEVLLQLSDDEKEQLKDYPDFELSENGFFLDTDALDSICDSVVYNSESSELATKIYNTRE